MDLKNFFENSFEFSYPSSPSSPSFPMFECRNKSV